MIFISRLRPSASVDDSDDEGQSVGLVKSIGPDGTALADRDKTAHEQVKLNEPLIAN